MYHVILPIVDYQSGLVVGKETATLEQFFTLELEELSGHCLDSEMERRTVAQHLADSFKDVLDIVWIIKG